MNNETTWFPGMTLDQIEKKIILAAFRHYGGVQTTTANALGISVRTLRNKLVSYQVKGVTKDDGDEGTATVGAYSVGTGASDANAPDGSANNGGGANHVGARVEPQNAAPASIQAQPRPPMEPASPVAPQRAVPVREREEVQEVLPRGTPVNGPNRRKA